jgi:hypothetical protein
MSPKEYSALCKCYQEQVDHLDWHMAGLKAVIANCAGVKITAEDFMGKRKETTYPTDEQLEEQLTSIFGCGPDTQKEGK